MTSFPSDRASLASGVTSVESVTASYLDRAKTRANLNAYLETFDDDALSQARLVDRRLREGNAGPLAGMVVAVKDILCMKGRRVSCGSKVLESFVAPYDATAIERLRQADAVIVGRTNMDEFAMGSSTENSAYGRVKHPADTDRVPGGSSGGSAVAVAAGLSSAALGTDTGGSIRQPAAFTGVVGMKPTYGRVSRFGLVAFASSLDCIGPITRTVGDAANLLSVIAGRDDRDATCSDKPIDFSPEMLTGDVSGVRVGLPREYFAEGLHPDVRSAAEKKVDALRSAGASIVEVSLPHTDYTIAAYYILATAEASSNLARYDGARYGFRDAASSTVGEMYLRSRTMGFGDEVKRRIMLGTYVLSAGYYDAYYAKGQKVRRLIRDDFLRAFSSVDCLVTPTTPSTAFPAGERSSDPLEMYLSDVYTVSANLAGIPAISVPCGIDTAGLPIGLQILGKHFDERTTLNVALAVERSNN